MKTVASIDVKATFNGVPRKYTQETKSITEIQKNS